MMAKERRKKKPEEDECLIAYLGKKEEQTLMELQPQHQQKKMVGEEDMENKIEQISIDKGKSNHENEENHGKIGGEGKKDEEKPPPPPEFVVMRVLMHCEGCAKKVRRCVKGLEGVEGVKTDCKTNTVVVKGKKVAQDPRKVADRIYRKSGKRVEIISPIPVSEPVTVPVLPPVTAIVETDPEKKPVGEVHKIEDKKEAQGIMVVLKIHMHCEACTEAIKNRILRLREVHEVVADLRASQVMVKGRFDPKSLVQYIYKRTGKTAVVVKQEPIYGADHALTNPKSDNDSKSNKEDEKEKRGKEKEESKEKEFVGAPLTTVVTVTGHGTGTGMGGTMGNYYCYPKYPVEYGYQYPPYPPQIFSDENPNACVVM